KQWGGQELRTLIEVEEANRDGHEAIAVVNEEGRMRQHAQERGTPHFPMSLKSSFDPRGATQLAQLVWKFRPDVICCHGARDFYLSLPYRALGIPIVRYRHISGLVTPSFSRSFAYTTGATAVVATADCIRRQFIEKNKVKPERITVIGEGVDLKHFEHGVDGVAARAEFGFGPQDIVAGTVAMVRSDKGYDTLVTAAKKACDRYPNLRFLFVGGPTRDGAWFQQVQDYSKQLGLEGRVIWTGWRKDVPQLMAAMDIFILASNGGEGQSRVIPEAFALRKPVIGTNVGGIPELIEDGRTGLLVPPRDPEALAEAVGRYVSNPALRESCADAGHELAVSKLDIRLRMKESYELYNRLLGRKR
ncbi:MAG TPA: glycosyltransferase family 4 protein, partial [Candidatus Methylacidiphilales bacterium]|nr:glycosyltransferase family 4 protein [Candidatus Methylacidiphilales bacterium]